MFIDIRRICEHPTEEDKRWFPEIANSNWLDTLHFAMKNFKDESFISQYLSPKLMRDFKLFYLHDDEKENFIDVAAIHNESGYKKVRSALSEQYNLSNLEVNIQVTNADVDGDRSLTLKYTPHQNVPLDDSKDEVMKHLYTLWQFDVRLVQNNEEGDEEVIAQYPE
jgi:spore cortex formation protein SpoVR/YcgB (stage V sporulation)